LLGLEKTHLVAVKLYGEGNEKRLSGKFETSSMDKFSSGVMNRAASVRIPQLTQDNGKGYYEDRRPAANCDPYIVSSVVFSSTCLDGVHIDELVAQYELFQHAKLNATH